jgi:hypothetical protein
MSRVSERKKTTALDRPDIHLPDGRVLGTRAKVAQKNGVCERTLFRKNVETTYIGGVAYCDYNSAVLDLAGELKRRNQPTKRHAR